jgi:hypothetical protein
MERPAYLRQDLYSNILKDVSEISANVLAEKLHIYGYDVPINAVKNELIDVILTNPSRYLAHTGILDKSDLLTNLFIEFDDGALDEGHTYLMDKEAAEEIAAGESVILLRSGREGAMVPRKRIEQAFLNGCVIDYHQKQRP